MMIRLINRYRDVIFLFGFGTALVIVAVLGG